MSIDIQSTKTNFFRHELRIAKIAEGFDAARIRSLGFHAVVLGTQQKSHAAICKEVGLKVFLEVYEESECKVDAMYSQGSARADSAYGTIFENQLMEMERLELAGYPLLFETDRLQLLDFAGSQTAFVFSAEDLQCFQTLWRRSHPSITPLIPKIRQGIIPSPFVLERALHGARDHTLGGILIEMKQMPKKGSLQEFGLKLVAACKIPLEKSLEEMDSPFSYEQLIELSCIEKKITQLEEARNGKIVADSISADLQLWEGKIPAEIQEKFFQVAEKRKITFSSKGHHPIMGSLFGRVL